MSQSLACINIHLIFSTKDRIRLINDQVRHRFHSYLFSLLGDHGCWTITINSVEDHVHLLFRLPRTVAVSRVVEHVKTASSRWFKSVSPEHRTFSWQGGYGAFSVSESNLETVKSYIRGQREHHRRVTFQEEFLAFLKKHQVEYNERYLWD